MKKEEENESEKESIISYSSGNSQYFACFPNYQFLIFLMIVVLHLRESIYLI